MRNINNKKNIIEYRTIVKKVKKETVIKHDNKISFFFSGNDNNQFKNFPFFKSLIISEEKYIEVNNPVKFTTEKPKSKKTLFFSPINNFDDKKRAIIKKMLEIEITKKNLSLILFFINREKRKIILLIFFITVQN